jgi:flavin reductase (DIM6/NTAB) family NADH-FMN oxidoreductase RutF
MREIDPSTLSASERHKLLIGCVTPRPIAFVSSVSRDGHTNLAPFSFFNAAGSAPMTLLFCIGAKPGGGDKDTLRNVVPAAEGGVGEFVVNLAVEDYARQMSATADPLPYGESELEMAAFTPAPSRRVKPPRVLESPVSFECLTSHVIRLGTGEPGSSTVVLGHVVHVWLREDVADERLRIDPAALRTIGRMGGPTYCRTRERFDLPRDQSALSVPPPFDTDVGTAAFRARIGGEKDG